MADIAQARLGNGPAGRDDHIDRRGTTIAARGRLEGDAIPDSGTPTLTHLGNMDIIVPPCGVAHEAVAALIVPLDYVAGFAHCRPAAARMSNKGGRLTPVHQAAICY